MKRAIKGVIIKMFQFPCYVLALYYTVLQFKSYIGNDDSSSVSYRRFNIGENDLYPTYSICIDTWWFKLKGGIFKNEPFLGIEGLSNREAYFDMLTGDRNITSKFAQIVFDDVLLSLNCLLYTSPEPTRPY